MISNIMPQTCDNVLDISVGLSVGFWVVDGDREACQPKERAQLLENFAHYLSAVRKEHKGGNHVRQRPTIEEDRRSLPGFCF